MVRNFRICKEVKTCLKELYNNSKLLMIIPEKYVQYETTIDRSKLYCSDERLVHYHVSIQSRAGFQLMPTIEQLILKFIEAGLCTNWRVFQIYEQKLINKNASEVTTFRINDKRTFDKIQGNRNDIFSLNIGHIVGALIFFVLGNLLALFIFLLEMIVIKFSKATTNRFVLILTYVMDPHQM